MSIAMPVVDAQRADSEQPSSPVPAPDYVGPNGRLKAGTLADTDRNFAIAMHLSPFGWLIIGPLAFAAPLVLWLVRKDASPFSDDHGREILNFMISLIVWSLICMITIIGIPLLIGLAVVAVVSPIRAAVAAGRGEYFRYPMTFRML